MPTLRHLPCLLLALAACTAGEADRLDVAVRDTLPGGMVRVTSPGPTAWRDSTGFSLVEDLRVTPEAGAPGELISPSSLAVDDAGRIYVADEKPAVVKVYNPDGSFSHTIGREGGGPGEFESPFLAVHGTQLVAHDPAQSRTSVFGLDGTFERSWTSNCCYWSPIAVDAGGVIHLPAVGPGGPESFFDTRWRLDGTAVDTVALTRTVEERYWHLKLGTMEMITSIPFVPESQSAYTPDGGYITGFPDQYQLVRLSASGDTTLVFGRAWSAEPIPESAKDEAVERMVTNLSRRGSEEEVRKVVKVADLPATAPAYTDVQVDGTGRVWVRSGVARDDAPARYDIFDAEGAWLGSVTTPGPIRRYGPVAWTRDAIVQVQENADGLPTLVRWRFTPGAGS